jgi:hypothetical protein
MSCKCGSILALTVLFSHMESPAVDEVESTVDAKVSKKPLNVEPNIIWVSTKKRPQFYAVRHSISIDCPIQRFASRFFVPICDVCFIQNIAHGMLTDCFDKVVIQGIGNGIMLSFYFSQVYCFHRICFSPCFSDRRCSRSSSVGHHCSFLRYLQYDFIISSLSLWLSCSSLCFLFDFSQRSGRRR